MCSKIIPEGGLKEALKIVGLKAKKKSNKIINDDD